MRHDWRRRNGWALPWNGMQVGSWIVLNCMAAMSALVSLPLPGSPFITLSLGVGLLWTLVCIIYLTSTDPGTDEKVIPAPFDRARHHHVIENNFCNICQLTVDKGTKHCRHCNKCIPLFDHHCKWLNNCIGGKNYRAFLMLVTSLVLYSFASTILFAWALGLFITNTTHAAPIPSSFAREWMVLDVWNWFVLCIVVMLFELIVFGSTLHLLSFHVMLWFNNMTTFSYIVEQRQKSRVGDISCLSSELQTHTESSDQTMQSTKSLPAANTKGSLTNGLGKSTRTVSDSYSFSVPANGLHTTSTGTAAT